MNGAFELVLIPDNVEVFYFQPPRMWMNPNNRKIFDVISECVVLAGQAHQNSGAL